MTERPILFGAPMVRALLAGTKTQTRRVVKPQPKHPGFKGMLAQDDEGIDLYLQDRTLHHAVRCPYGLPGDRLWVRETWGYIDPDCTGEDNDDDPEGPGPTAFCDELLQEGHPMRDFWRRRVAYRASWQDPKYGIGPDAPKQWRPSIQMPRWASRITLEVTGVRVERLGDISEADALAEGIDMNQPVTMPMSPGSPATVTLKPRSAREAYACLWQDINGSWAPSTWVWVVEFRRLTP